MADIKDMNVKDNYYISCYDRTKSYPIKSFVAANIMDAAEIAKEQLNATSANGIVEIRIMTKEHHYNRRDLKV